MSTATAVESPTKTGLRWPSFSAGTFGTVLLLLIAVPCFLSLPITLGTPIGAESGERYNDLRYQESAQEQWPGTIYYTRTITPKADDGSVIEGAEPVVTRYRGFELMGTDQQGRSVLIRCLLGGAISLGVGISAALMAVFIGVTWGSLAGYVGGRTDAFMMRVVDVLYGLPYLLLVVLLSVAVSGVVSNIADGFVTIPGVAIGLWDASPAVYILAVVGGFALMFGAAVLLFKLVGVLSKNASGVLDMAGFAVRLLTVLVGAGAVFGLVWAVVLGLLMPGMNDAGLAPVPEWIKTLLTDYPLVINLLTLVVAIGGVSWLTMARVIRGQVLSLRTEPFIEAARAQGMGPARIIRVHLLPNLIGPIVVYTTLAVPQAILQESFLSFLGIGVSEPLPSWGQLASIGIKELPALALPELNQQFKWWLLVFPCLLLGLTLLSLNFMGDAMRERFDPRSKRRGA
ncbi:MAG: ABC transporter permease [Phycisphaeraceae bacterium]